MTNARLILVAAVVLANALFALPAYALPVDVNDVILACQGTKGCKVGAAPDGGSVIGGNSDFDFVCVRIPNTDKFNCNYFPAQQ